jgi:hypothetical protein
VNDKPDTQSGAKSNVPLALIGGFAMLSVAVYFGIRDRAPAGRAEALPPAATSAGPARPTAATSSIPTPQASHAAPSFDAADIERTFSQQKSALMTACVGPAQAEGSAPKPVELWFRLSFGADGTQSGLGVRQIGGIVDPKLVICLREKSSRLRIPATGKAEATVVQTMFP